MEREIFIRLTRNFFVPKLNRTKIIWWNAQQTSRNFQFENNLCSNKISHFEFSFSDVFCLFIYFETAPAILESKFGFRLSSANRNKFNSKYWRQLENWEAPMIENKYLPKTQRSIGKSACQENCPWGPVCAPKSMKSSPSASTSWKFCCSWRALLWPFLIRLWCFPFFKTAQMTRINSKWNNFRPNIAIKTWKLNSSVASHLAL